MTLHPSLGHAIEALEGGELVVIPTDTVYGIAASIADQSALRRVFELKGRPLDKPLPVLGAGLDQIRSVGVLDAAATALAARFWPGPLTLVVPRAPGFTADLGGTAASTVAVRVPAHEIALEVLGATGPLAVTSANRSGEAEATTLEQARAALGEDIVYVDGGRVGGTVSTVVAVGKGVEVLRPGAVSEAEIRQIVTS